MSKPTSEQIDTLAQELLKLTEPSAYIDTVDTTKRYLYRNIATHVLKETRAAEAAAWDKAVLEAKSHINDEHVSRRVSRMRNPYRDVENGLYWLKDKRSEIRYGMVRNSKQWPEKPWQNELTDAAVLEDFHLALVDRAV